MWPHLIVLSHSGSCNKMQPLIQYFFLCSFISMLNPCSMLKQLDIIVKKKIKQHFLYGHTVKRRTSNPVWSMDALGHTKTTCTILRANIWLSILCSYCGNWGKNTLTVMTSEMVIHVCDCTKCCICWIELKAEWVMVKGLPRGRYTDKLLALVKTSCNM